jgi:hypothetical protein
MLAELVERAIAYALLGWHVLPLHGIVTTGPKVGRDRARCSCRSGTCESQGKHPRTTHGLKDATTDPGIIRQWWARWPTANVGVVTGLGFDVLDVDGLEAREALRACAPLPGHGLYGPTVRTGRGWHVYVAPTGLGNRAGLVEGCDWRGRGGLVVAPPSRHASGATYRWVNGPAEPLGPVPPWLHALIRPPKPPRRPSEARGPVRLTSYGRAALEAECGTVAASVNGTRNHTLNRASFRLGQLVAAGALDEHEATDGLVGAAVAAGLGEREALLTIGSGLAAGNRYPRQGSAR